MELNKSTKILPIIDKYPKVYDALFKLSSKVKRLKNPVARKTMGKKATLEMLSQMLKVSLEKLISTIQNAIETSGNEDEKDRKEMLKKLLLDIHKGVDIEILKKQFKEIAEGITSYEIGQLEQQLIDEGVLDPKEITKLSDLHVELFRDALGVKADYETIPGHPIHTYLQENLEAANLIRKIRSSAKETDRIKLFRELGKIVTHYARKENQLFPILEKEGISGPPQVMWAVHDEIRGILKTEKSDEIDSALKKVEDMIYKEEHILFPMTLESFTESDWINVRKGEEEIGFVFGVEPGDEWKPVTAADVHKPKPSLTTTSEKELNLDIGNLTLEQINIMLKTLPVDLTFVNEKDEVAYYSDAEDRIFPRSRGIIGRSVQKCHPPNSVDVVKDILQKFKSGEKNIAEFWIQLEGNFILIRYFAMRDNNGKYVGTLEVSQEVSHIRALEGERRLVQWGD